MTLDRISITKTIANVEQLLKDDPALSPALNAAIQMLIMAVQLLADRAKLDSRNSSKPPATDPHRARILRGQTLRLTLFSFFPACFTT